MTVFVFPGQGSQSKGMGGELFDHVAEFKAVESQVDDILGYSVRRQCLEDPGDVLSQTEYTQPCLYVVNALHYYQALAEGESPDYVAGHSLGEYNALLAAGAFDFLTGLELVKKRGELMAQARDGGMAAVIGLEAEELARALRERGLDSVDFANYNAPDQIVISGPSEEIDKATEAADEAGAKLCTRLKVSGAFHSRYMADAASEFQSFLAGYSFHPTQLPVIANVTGRPYPPGDADLTIRAFLARQMTQSVKWSQTMAYFSELVETDIREKGPGTVLSKLVEKNEVAKAA